jgi:HSP20 family protein
MAFTRREPERSWLEPFERSLLGWPGRPFEAFRQLMSENELKVEEFMEGDHIVVRAELPGVDPDRDIDVDVVDGMLRIKGERRQEHTVEEKNYRRSEISYGTFTRTIPLPPGTKEDGIEATYKDGVLEVRAPVDDRTGRPSKITIKRP